MILLIGHGSIRRSVMGNGDRKASAKDLERMKALVDREMSAGAWGMSTGLIYLPGRYADQAELVELSKVVARHGGIYASHIRDESAGLLRSIDETLAIGKEAGLPVHISHLKVTGKPNWGLVRPACERIQAARKDGQIVTADQYPYIASSTSLAAFVVPDWARQGSAADFAKIAADPVQGARLREEIAKELSERDGGASVRIARYPTKPSRVGKDLVTIARQEGTDPVSVVIDIESHGGAQGISFGMGEDDVRFVMAQEFVATASDASAHAPGGLDRPHPRAYGTFPRQIRYALDDHLLPARTARSAPLLRPAGRGPAELPDRGRACEPARSRTSSFSTRRPSATRPPSTSRPFMQKGVQHLLRATADLWRRSRMARCSASSPGEA